MLDCLKAKPQLPVPHSSRQQLAELTGCNPVNGSLKQGFGFGFFDGDAAVVSWAFCRFLDNHFCVFDGVEL